MLVTTKALLPLLRHCFIVDKFSVLSSQKILRIACLKAVILNFIFAEAWGADPSPASACHIGG
ncbi:MAG: hypothetical protein U5O16_03130 [Rhodococcus sp. (in: high G+C Gram-positive bacteria)]|nr:hypothetical protein [Rhodococcus sp. (in: high G+C Gram-positive bacteria)]